MTLVEFSHRRAEQERDRGVRNPVEEAQLVDAYYAHRLAELIFKSFAPEDEAQPSDIRPRLPDNRKQPPFNAYFRAERGLFLGMIDGSPLSIRSQFGDWRIGGVAVATAKQSVEAAAADLFSHLQVETVERHPDASGRLGPLYAVYAIDNEELPPPVHGDYASYTSAETLAERWARACEQFQDEAAEFEEPIVAA